MRQKLLLCCSVVFLALVPLELAASTYYVSPTGNDGNPGTASHPWQTIQKAAVTVQAGDTVIIKDGVYGGGISVEQPGSATAPIVFRAEGQGAIIDGSGGKRDAFFIDGYALNPVYWQGADMYLTVQGLTIKNATRAGLRISCAHHVSVLNCTLQDNGTWGIFTDFSNYSVLQGNRCSGSKEQHGIYVSNSSDYPVIRNNVVFNNNDCGIQINADPSTVPEGDGICTGALIENNIAYGNGQGGGAAINLASVRKSVVRNNLLYNNYAGGIAGWGDGNGPAWGCKNNQICNNTIYFRSAEGRWAISLKEGSTGCVVRNNILCGGARGGFEFDNTGTLAGLQMDYNLFYSADLGPLVVAREDTNEWITLSQWQAVAGQDGHSFGAAPVAVFVNYPAADFHLKAGSPAINAGDPAPAYNDPDGTRNDLGAYGGPAAPGPVPPKGTNWLLLLGD
jgi:parallel beta-helix repeat protein